MSAAEAGLEIHVYGIHPMSYFSFHGGDAQAKMTFYVQEMLKHGILASNRFYANFAQQTSHVEQFAAATRSVFKDMAHLSLQGPIATHLIGGVSRPGFHRLN